MPNDLNPLSGLSSTPPSAIPSAGQAQSATFDVVGIRLELSASAGTAQLIVSRPGANETFAIEPVALAAWAVATTKLLSLQAAAVPSDRAEIRAPFLFDREGRPAIAFEALISELGVGYRLLVDAGAEPMVGVVATAEVVSDVGQAAAGVATAASPRS